jgi:hypothetical protein
MVGVGEHEESNSILSKYYDYKPLFEATDDKDGGAKDIDTDRLIYL